MTEAERSLVVKLTILRSALRLFAALYGDNSPDVRAVIADLKRLERRTQEQINEVLGD